MLAIELLKIVTLLLSLSLGGLASKFDDLESRMANLHLGSKNSKATLEELIASINGLAWTTRLLQHNNDFSCRLGPDHFRLLAGLDRCKSGGDAEKCSIKVVNEVFDHIMKSTSKPDKIKVLQAADSSLNNTTAAHLVASTFRHNYELLTLSKNSFTKQKGKNSKKNPKKKSKKPKKISKKETKQPRKKEPKKECNCVYFKSETLSSAINSLSISRIKVVNKDSANARILLGTEYKLEDLAAVDSSIWYLLTQLELYTDSLKSRHLCYYIAKIIECKIILRADVDIKHLNDSIENFRVYDHQIFPWYNYIVEKSLFKNKQQYKAKRTCELISKSLILEHPKSAAAILDANLPIENRGIHTHLLLLHDNPAKRLMRLKPIKIAELYSCFILASKFELSLKIIRHFREIPQKKLAELVSYLAELKKIESSFLILLLQLQVSYLNLVSLFKKDDGTVFLDMDFTRAFAQIPKTLELLDVLKSVEIKKDWFDGKPFNQYLSEKNNWDEAVEEHFHYFIPSFMITNYREMAESLVEYIGADINKDPSELKYWDQMFVERTIDKAPRHLNSYFEIIDKQTQNEPISSAKRLEIAMMGSMNLDETAEAAYKQSFVYHKRKALYPTIFNNPAFVGLTRICYKYKTYTHTRYDVLSFFNFERLVYRHFSGSLPQMDLERGFQKLKAKNNFSAVLDKFIKMNFTSYQLPFVLEGLQSLEEGLSKYNLEITIDFQIHRVPKMILLKVIYMALDDLSPDLNFAFVKYFYNTRLLYKSLA